MKKLMLCLLIAVGLVHHFCKRSDWYIDSLAALGINLNSSIAEEEDDPLSAKIYFWGMNKNPPSEPKPEGVQSTGLVKCTNREGNVTFSNSSCPASEKQEDVKGRKSIGTQNVFAKRDGNGNDTRRTREMQGELERAKRANDSRVSKTGAGNESSGKGDDLCRLIRGELVC